MDFITHLPRTKKGYDAIVVFVDMFSKMVHLAPSRTMATAPETAQIFFDNVVKLHGLPKTIEIPNSPVVSGKPSSTPWEPNSQCQRHFTLRQMVKLNEPT